MPKRTTLLERSLWEAQESLDIHSFRLTHLATINEALLNNVTSSLCHRGGKSLCYQLPAAVQGGVTVVLSLLVSLIYDKFTKLDGLESQADHIIGDDYGRQRKIYEKLCLLMPQTTLLYVTPEKVSASHKLNRVFRSLYSPIAHSMSSKNEVSKWFFSSFIRQNSTYEIQPEKSIQNCYAVLPVDCYSETTIKLPCSKGEIMDIVI
ncbi:Bloom syndrome protein -like protein [Caligus rogercresseyi]|uniref:Bloom syndrome protein -like protein n=1 Tax=Caligus rogercresseyi TaxID=217165 RepID=A0A7T8KE86_CALRO|nr:Bloom syndrome protein -like protein [Caligus rogercresseyi]